jgi:hypothetical protein
MDGVTGVDINPHCVVIFTHETRGRGPRARCWSEQWLPQGCLACLPGLRHGAVGTVSGWETAEHLLSPLRRQARGTEESRAAHGAEGLELARRAPGASQRLHHGDTRSRRPVCSDGQCQAPSCGLRAPLRHGEASRSTSRAVGRGPSQEPRQAGQPDRESRSPLEGRSCFRARSRAPLHSANSRTGRRDSGTACATRDLRGAP